MILGGRYFQLSNTVFSYGLTPIQLTVYSYLVSCAGSKEKCWPAMKTIAACSGCSKNAARDAIKELVRRGFIRKVETFRDEFNGKTRQTNNTYYILELPALQPSSPQVVFREGSFNGEEMNKQNEGNKYKRKRSQKDFDPEAAAL